MKVEQLRQMLANLRPVFEAAGARGVSGDLAALADGLAAFEGMTVAALLNLAESGRKPPPEPKPPREKKPPAPKAPKADPEACHREIADLYARAKEPAVTEEVVAAAVGRLKGLKKPDQVAVAAGIGVPAGKKTGPQLLEAIRARILDRQGATIRSELLDRPIPTIEETNPVNVGTFSSHTANS